MSIEQRAVWIVCIGIGYVESFDTMADDQSEWNCNRSMRFFEDWISELQDRP